MSQFLKARPFAAALLASSFLLAPAALADIHPAPGASKWEEPTYLGEGAPGEKTDDKKGLPLKAERKVEFETSEGTWLSLTVSPDGQTILFEMLGDIYSLPIAGGEAKPLLTGMEFQSQPAFSPDGKMIAYLSDEDGSENIYIANADGSEPKKLSSLSDGGMMSPSWSADGNYVYVSQLPKGLGANEIWMYHKLGGSGIQVTKAMPGGPSTPRAQQSNAQGPVASPDGKFLYYAQKAGGFAYNMDSFPWSIVRRNLDEGTTDTVATAYGSAMRPILSPDGKLMVYATRYEADTGLRVRNLETGADRWLAYPVTRDDQESRATRDLMPSYGFTPDGAAVIANSGGKIERIALADGARTVIPFIAKVSIDIGPNLVNQTPDPEGPVVARLMQTPALSPDGKSVVFSALGELYTLDLTKADSKPAKLDRAGQHVFQPSWSHDGKYITYISWTAEGGHVWRLKSSGGKPERLTRVPGYYSEPHYTPAGDEIVAVRGSNYQFNMGDPYSQRDLVALNVKSGAERTILVGTGFSGVHFGNAKDRVYLYGGMGPFSGSSGLFSVRLDGTDRRDHVLVKGKGLYFANEPVAARDMRMSPDGNYALARSEERLHVLVLPPQGGKLLEVNQHSPQVPFKTLFDIGADYFGWSEDGKTIFWSVGSTFYEQKLADVEWVDPKKDEKAEDKAEGETAVADAGTADAKADEPAAEQAAEKADEKAEEKPKAYTSRDVRVEVPRDNPAGTILLSGATVLTMGEAGVIENADILVVDGKFKAVGAKGSLEVPKGAEVRDMTGKYITPGFVDTHGHWENWSRNEVIEETFWPFVANLAYGVTSGLDVQTSTTDIFAYQDMVEAGRMVGFRAWSTGPGVFSDTAITSVDHAKEVLTRYRDHYRTKNIKAYVSGNRKTRQMIVEASKELGMMPTTEGALDVKLDITHMIDGFSGNEHALPVVPLYKDMVELIAQSGTSYTPTLLVTYGGPMGENYFYAHNNPHDDPKVNRFMPHHELDARSKRRPWFRDEEYSFTRVADSAIDAQRAGGKVGVGSHGQFQGLGYHWEMWALGSGKATPMEVLKAATIDGAHIIGHETEVGSIDPGKFADLVILDKDPREDIHNSLAIDKVMMNGRLYDGDTMNQEWPLKRDLPPFWFADQAPKTGK
ncbi:MAG: amidohydrolase [Alphaproteobacteria bacterium]|nr:MAG: amidohydrolase [Alphaproteobacteria bacterium]